MHHAINEQTNRTVSQSVKLRRRVDNPPATVRPPLSTEGGDEAADRPRKAARPTPRLHWSLRGDPVLKWQLIGELLCVVFLRVLFVKQ